MKTGTMNIMGKEYIACLSPRVMTNLQEKSGRTIYEELKYLNETLDIKDMFWLVHQMLKAGSVYAEKMGIAHPTDIPTEEDLLDLVGIDEMGQIFADLGLAVKNGTKADLQVKNAKSTRGR